MSWQVLHVDLKSGPIEIRATGPAYLEFGWGALPLGSLACTGNELPLPSDRLHALASRLIAHQIACRLPELAGPPPADVNGRPRIAPPLEALREERSMAEVLDALAEPARDSAEDVCVIICTRDRVEALAACLRAVASQHSPPGEILVVDNSEGRSAEAVCAGWAAVRYVHEPLPGLSRARNAGIRASTRKWIAFTDDDVEVQPYWTAELVRAFNTHPEVAAVTGLVVPATLDTHAQRYFQLQLGGFGACHLPVLFDADFFHASLPLGPQVWRIGAGASMGFRRDVFERVGLFDERLGAGRAGCSEDSELWYRILAAGGMCLYEPRALVHHHHRADWPGLQRQMRHYIRGHTAALVAQYDRFGHTGNMRRLAFQLPRYFLRTGYHALANGSRDRASLLCQEVLGWVSGLALALRPGWRRTAAAPRL